MSRTKSYCINVAPVPWQRPRLNGQRFFNGQQQDRISFGLFLQKQHGNQELFSKPIHMDVVFHMAIPINTKKKLKSTLNWHSIKPDLDNCCKFLWDALNGIVIVDDKIIVSMSAKKVYSDNPRTEFTLTEV